MMCDSPFYTDGGLIIGTDTCDRVAAQANDQPLAPSNGEYRIPAPIVELFGRDFFDRIVEKLYTPTGPEDGVMRVNDDPIDLQNDHYIIPADVVNMLDVGFFDQLVAQEGGAA